MNINYKKLSHSQINNQRKLSEFFVEFEGQVTEQDLKSLTKISYEELLKQSKMPILKRSKNDSHKNETPTTPSK